MADSDALFSGTLSVSTTGIHASHPMPHMYYSQSTTTSTRLSLEGKKMEAGTNVSMFRKIMKNSWQKWQKKAKHFGENNVFM